MGNRAKTIDLTEAQREKRLFHNEQIPVYYKELHVNQISFWPENARNILDFDMLTNQRGKDLDEIDEETIIKFLAKQPRLKLVDLKKSIEKNGVRIPLIVLEDGTLLDGNRRYFACKLLQYESERVPDVLRKIPAYVIRNKDIDEKKKKKVLAEANFVSDYRVEWTLDVRVKVICEYYKILRKEGLSDDRIYDEIEDVYAVKRKDASDYIAADRLAQEFLSEGKDKEDTLKRRQVLQSKFVYFWEFYNKTMKGRSALEQEEIPRVKKLFFLMMRTDKFDNLKQVEPMVRSVRDDYCWELLTESKGAKIDVIEVLYKESKAIKSAEDKIRNFFKWLDKIEPTELTKASLRLLDEISQKIRKFLKS